MQKIFEGCFDTPIRKFLSTNHKHIKRRFGWLNDWLIEWVSEWVSDWLDWLDWLIDWLTDCPVLSTLFQDFDELIDMASRGDHRKVDTMSGDMKVKNRKDTDVYSLMPEMFVIFTLGKMAEESNKGLIRIFNNKIREKCAIHSFFHSLIQVMSIVPLQVHYYPEALPIHGYCIAVSRRSATGNCEWRTCPKALRGG